MPGLVSTLLNQMYSAPRRLVQTFLQVTEQVWQPMHLSRFITIPIWARTLIGGPRSSVDDLRGPLADNDQLVALRPGRPVVVEAPGELRVAADQVGRLDH